MSGTAEKSKFQKVIASLILFLSTSAGRQKLCRLVQYYCKYLSLKYRDQYQQLVFDRPIIADKIAKTQSLMNAMGMARKILRFGPSIQCIRTIINNVNELLENKNVQPAHIVILKTLGTFFLGMYFLCDHYIWLQKVKLLNNPQLKLKLEYLSSLGWVLECVTAIVRNIVVLVEMKPEDKEKVQTDTIVDLARASLDFPVSIYFLKPDSVNGKVAGLLGTVTSFIGIYKLWK